MKIKQFIRGRMGKGTLAVVTAVALALVIGLNLLVTYFGVPGLLFVDMTPEELYTVSPEMKEHTSFIDGLEEKVRITFCTDPDFLTMSRSTRLPYFLALGLDAIYDNVEVDTVNVAYNPTAVSKYKANSLSKIESGDMIVSYGDRYRVVNTESFWVNDTDGNLYSFNGEYKMASVIMSVTKVNRPAAYFVTNHGETYYDAKDPSRVENAAAQSIYDLLTERGLEVKTLDLSDPEVKGVPEDCVLLVINNPREDFKYDPDKIDSIEYISETEMLDRYLVKNQGAIMVSKDPTLNAPVLDGFLYEWGFDISDSIVKDMENYMMSDTAVEYGKIIGIYDTDEESYGMAIYEDYATLPSAPAMVFQNTGYISCSFGPGMSTNEPGSVVTNRNYAPFFYSSDVAKAYAKGAGGNYSEIEYDAYHSGRMDIAGVTTRMEINNKTSEYKYSYLFCSPSADAFSNEILGNASYANYDIMSALVENISRIDEHASLELGGTSLNSDKLGGKPFVNTAISATATTKYNSATGRDEIVKWGLTSGDKTFLTVLVMLVPTAIATVGIIVRVKRKYK